MKKPDLSAPEAIEIPTSLEVPKTLTNPQKVGDVPKKQTRRTTMEVDAALTKHTDPLKGTNRAAAAEELGITLQSLENRICRIPFLTTRWSRAASLAHMRDEMKNLNTPQEQINMEAILHREIDAKLVGLSIFTQRLIKQIDLLELRIARHEAAMEMDESHPDYKKMGKYLFRLSCKGEPKEEEMVRKNLEVLYAEFRQHADLGVGSMLTKARISSEYKIKGASGGRGVGGNGKPKGLGVAPKGSRPVMQQPTTLIDARGANLIVQNGNGRPDASTAGNGPADIRPTTTGQATADTPQ